MPFPKWHSNNTNVARTNAIIKTLAEMFKDESGTVPIIAPLNEWVDVILDFNGCGNVVFLLADPQVLMANKS
jgi:hypothetical protein